MPTMVDQSAPKVLDVTPLVYHGPAMWWLAALILLTGAAVPVLGLGSSQWFARSGCMVVMLGIWSGLGGVIWGKILDKRLAIRQHHSRRRLQSKYRYEPDVLDEELAHLDKRFAELVEKHHKRLQLSIGVQEATLLLLGTFVWGFGDLIGMFVPW